MKKIIQKAKIKIIRPLMVNYYCDKCGKRTGTRENPKETWHGPDGETHYCKKTCSQEKK